MSAFALFSSVDQYNQASHLEGKSYVAIFGSVKIDFSRTQLMPGEHAVTVLALFGSVKLVFPAEVEVYLEGVPIFGSAELKDKRPAGADAPRSGVRVQVRGAALFGSVEVVRSAPASVAPQAPYQLTGDERFHPVTGEPITGEPRPYEGATRKIGSDE
jgi:hypothetical protein